MSEKSKSQEEYWKNNFNDDKIVSSSDDLQINIARTKNGERVKREVWDKTISYISNIISINRNSVILELCCGNGVVIGELAKYCDKAYGVDYSNILLNQLKKTFKSKNLFVKQGDVNTCEIGKEKFGAIIIYFSLQHFNEKHTFLLIEKSIKALKPNGKILIGDIPDLDRKWTYINKIKHHKDYFKRVVEGKPKIGHWFQKDFFTAMNNCFSNVKFTILNQPNYQINSDHCFDVIIEKNAPK